MKNLVTKSLNLVTLVEDLPPYDVALAPELVSQLEDTLQVESVTSSFCTLSGDKITIDPVSFVKKSGCIFFAQNLVTKSLNLVE